jgi:hypothetical protein
MILAILEARCTMQHAIRLILLASFVFHCGSVVCDTLPPRQLDPTVRENFELGNKSFAEGKFAEAESFYRKSLSACGASVAPPPEITHNLAITLYRLGKRKAGDGVYRTFLKKECSTISSGAVGRTAPRSWFQQLYIPEHRRWHNWIAKLILTGLGIIGGLASFAALAGDDEMPLGFVVLLLGMGIAYVGYLV